MKSIYLKKVIYYRRRYDYMEEAKKGLKVPTILFTYSPGSNLCNLHWIWHTSATDINSALQFNYV